MLEKSKILSEVNNREGVSYIFLYIFDSEIKPFIIAVRIGIVLNEEHVGVELD
jgi:hypothetical protein